MSQELSQETSQELSQETSQELSQETSQELFQLTALSKHELFNLLQTNVNSFREYINTHNRTSYAIPSNLNVTAAKELTHFLEDSGRLDTLEIGRGGVMLTDVAQIVFQALMKNITLKYLIIKYGQIENLSALANLLKENKILTKIYFANVKLIAADLKILATGLKENNTIQYIEFASCDITNDANQVRDLSGLQLLLDNLGTRDHLYFINIDMGPDGADMIGKWLATNPALAILTLVANIKNIGSIALGLQTNYNLTKLNLNNNKLIYSDYDTVAQMLQHNSTLQDLDLSNTLIQDEDMIKIAAGLKGNNFLQVINLSHNNITDRGAEAVAEALKINNSLKELFLINNKIREAGATSLGAMLAINTGLTHIILHNNGNITNEGASKLYQGLKYNGSIYLGLDNDISDPKLRKLIAAKNEINRHNVHVNSLTLVQILKNYKK